MVIEDPIGYGFVHFETQEAADTAVKKVNGMLIAEKKVIVTGYIRKQDRSKSSPTFTNVYVKEINASIDSKQLETYFNTFGKVTSCFISLDKDGKSRQFGFVNFETAQAAKDVIDNCNGKIIEGISISNKPLYVGKAEKKEDRVKKLRDDYEKKKLETIQKYQGLNIYVKNLDDSIDTTKLKELFTVYGELQNTYIAKDENGLSRGFGFVCFKNSEDATKAIAEMHGKIISNKPLFVTLAQRKEQRVIELQATYQQRQQRQLMMGGNNPMFQQRYQNQYGVVKPRFIGNQNKQFQNKPNLQSNFQKKPQQQQGQQQKPQFNKQQRMDNNFNQQQFQQQQQQNQQQGSEVKYNVNVRNPKQQQQQQQKQKQSQQQTTETSRTGLDPTYLASLTPSAQKQTLGENLFPLVQNEVPHLAGKITGMLLEMDNSDILNLLESPEALKAKIAEAVNVVKAHEKN